MLTRNRIAIPTLTIALVALALVPAARAERQVDEKAAADAAGTVVVENIAGSIVIEGWDRDEVHVTGTLGDDVEDLFFKSKGRKTIIEVEYPHKAKNIDEGADLLIKVPRGSSLEIECIAAPITIGGVAGAIYAGSISGDVEITGTCRSLEAETISGDLLVDGGAPEMEVESISGTVKVRAGTAALEAHTVAGKIDLVLDTYLELSVESVSGSADVEGALAKGGKYEFELHSGDLVLTLPDDTSADFEIDTFSGDIDSVWGGEPERTSKYAPGKELEFTVGDGEARVRINTFSGDVVIRKR